VQLEQFAVAWGIAAAEEQTSRPLRIRIVGEADDVAYEL